MVKIKNALFCELAIETGDITRDSMVEALKFQYELTKKDQHTRIGTILVDKGFMSNEKVLKILESQHIFIYKCSACGKQYNIPFANQDLNYFCLRDEELLSKVSTKDVRSVKVDGIIHFSMGFPGGFSPLDKRSKLPILNRDDKKNSSSQTSNTKFNFKQVQLDSERLKTGTSLYTQESQKSNLSENVGRTSRRDRVQLDPKILAAMDKGEKTASLRKEMMSKKLVQREFEVTPDKVDTAQIKAFESMNFEYKTTVDDVESEFQREDVVREEMPVVPVDNLEVLAEKAIDRIDKINIASEVDDQNLQPDLFIADADKMPADESIESDLSDFDLQSEQFLTVVEKTLADEEIETDRMILAESVSSDRVIPTQSDEKEAEAPVADEDVAENAEVSSEDVDEREYEDEEIIVEQAVVAVDSTQPTKYDFKDEQAVSESETMDIDVMDNETSEERKQAKLRLSEILRYDSIEDNTNGIKDFKKIVNDEVKEDKEITEVLEKIYKEDELGDLFAENIAETVAKTDGISTESTDKVEITDSVKEKELKSLEDVDLSDLLKSDFTPPESNDTEFAIVTRKVSEIGFDEQSEHIPPNDSDTLLEIKLKADELETEDAESTEEEKVDEKTITSEKKITEDTTKRNEIPEKYRAMSSDAAIMTNSKDVPSVSDVAETKKDLKEYLSEVEKKLSYKELSTLDEPETETMELYPAPKEESDDKDSKPSVSEDDETNIDSESTDIRAILKDSSTELYFREKNDYDDIDFDIEALDEMLNQDIGIDEFEDALKDEESRSILGKTLLDDSELENREEVEIPDRFATKRPNKLGPSDEPYEEYKVNIELPKTGFAKFFDTLKKALVNFVNKFNSES